MVVNIAVIGAGVSGLSSAINVQRTIVNARVTVIADRFGLDTVSHGAGGFFRPKMDDFVNDANIDVMTQCVKDSWKHFSTLAQSDQAKESGNYLVSGLIVGDKNEDAGYAVMKELVYDFHSLTESDLRSRGLSYKFGYSCTTVMSQSPYYLTWLMKQFKLGGGHVRRQTVADIKELFSEFDLVINCCGLGAETLVKDKECFPVRGQLAYVKAPWVKHFFFAGLVYIFPHIERVLIGGIRDKGDYRQDVDPQVEDRIIENAEAIFPELKGAERLPGWAGLRPGRTSIRLETEMLDVGGRGRFPVIHNYGHGGHGVTLSWGCGVHVAKLVKAALSGVPKSAL